MNTDEIARGKDMGLSVAQREFLHSEFDIDESLLYNLAPLKLWMLREDCIEIECDEAMTYTNEVTFRGNLAASLVDVISSLLPKDWRCKTPMQVQAECLEEEIRKSMFLRDQVAIAM